MMTLYLINLEHLHAHVRALLIYYIFYLKALLR
jgi:hypothetical protein